MYAAQKRQSIIEAKSKPGKAVYACMERRQGWSASMPIYMLHCPRCKETTETYPHGYGRIRCDTAGCGYNVRVGTWARTRDKTILPMVVPLGIIAFFFLSAMACGAFLHHILSH